jgi:hypothetical protein
LPSPQYSMAPAAALVAEASGRPVLTTPDSAVQKLKEMLAVVSWLENPIARTKSNDEWSATQCRSNPVSGRSLPKTGVFQMSAAQLRQQARAADVSQSRVIGWQVETRSPAWLLRVRCRRGTGKLSKSRLAAARSLSLRPRQTQPERLHTRDGRFETRENYSRLFSAPECRLWVLCSH